MKDLSPLHHFFGVSVEQWSDDLFLHQHQLSKWFYDTSTGVATGATHCGSFAGEGFDLLIDSYG
jgi:hypothetical protein